MTEQNLHELAIEIQEAKIETLHVKQTLQEAKNQIKYLQHQLEAQIAENLQLETQLQQVKNELQKIYN